MISTLNSVWDRSAAIAIIGEFFRCAHCTLHTAHCTLHTANCTMHAAHCTLYIARCMLHIAHCTLHIARWSVFGHLSHFRTLAAPIKFFGLFLYTITWDWFTLLVHKNQTGKLAIDKLWLFHVSCRKFSCRNARGANMLWNHFAMCMMSFFE